jgi:hypothetical protein
MQQQEAVKLGLSTVGVLLQAALIVRHFIVDFNFNSVA